MAAELSEQDFMVLRHYVERICGISLSGEKKYLVEQRLQPLIEYYGLHSFAELALKVTKDDSFLLRDQITAEITTNETYFFRDTYPFDGLKERILPDLLDTIRKRKMPGQERKGPKIRIWSAASSTGQEPLSIAMIINEFAFLHKHRGLDVSDFSILATDISNKALAKAMNGEYSGLEVSRGLTKVQIERYFIKRGDLFVAKPEIHQLIEYRKINLAEQFSLIGSFDIIFCRNVLIYFNNDIKTRIFAQLQRMLPPGGFLVLGASENLFGLSDAFERYPQYEKATIFIRR